jgi:hypothetical protein
MVNVEVEIHVAGPEDLADGSQRPPSDRLTVGRHRLKKMLMVRIREV